MAGLLDFLFAQPPAGAPNMTPWGLLGQIGGRQPQEAYEPDEQTRALQQQLNRAPTAPMSQMMSPEPLTPSPILPGSFMPPGAALQPSTQGWTGGDPQDRPAIGAALAGPATASPASVPALTPRPQGLLDQPRDVRPPIQQQTEALQPTGQIPAGQNTSQAGGALGGFGKLLDAIGGIYGKGGPGDNLIALGAGLASGGGNWGQGLMRGMAMINANQLTAKKREDEQKRAQGQMTMAQEIERRSKGQIPASVALGAIQSGAGGQFLQDVFRKQEVMRPLTDPAERARLGIPETDRGIYQIDSSGKISAVGTPSTNINMQAETEESKVTGKAAGERQVKVLDAGASAQENIQRLALTKRLLDEFQTGRLANVQRTFADFGLGVGMSPDMLRKMGIDPNKSVTGAAAEAEISRALVGMIGQGQFPANNFSNADRAFLENTLPKLTNQPGANNIMIEAQVRLQNLAIERANAWREAKSRGMKFDQFESDWSKQMQSRDIFKDLVPANLFPTQQGQGQGQQQPGRARILRRLD